MTLQEFLNRNTVDGITKETVIGDRFKDENGGEFKFVIKGLTQKEFNELRKRASSFDKNGRMILNEGLLSTLCIIENTVTPNFKDAKSIQELGCSTPEQYLNKVLLAGEAENLAREILQLSGFGKNINELVDEAKN